MFTNSRHHSLIAWQRADDHSRSSSLAVSCGKRPYSVAANTVERFARRSGKSRLNFLNVSEASLSEVGYCVHVAHRLGYISDDLAAELEKDVNGVGAPLAGLVRSTRADVALVAICVAAAVVLVSWLAA